MRKKQIIIRNEDNIEDYLDIDLRHGRQLKYLDLMKNKRVKGVKELLAIIPGGFDIDRIREFHEKTGLKLRVTHYNDQYEISWFDRNGVYPRPFLNIYNQEVMDHLSEHPEWLEPQEECDLEIRYIDSIDKDLLAL